MAIFIADELEEITKEDLTENDVLLAYTQTGFKKIKPSEIVSLGGESAGEGGNASGGGSSGASADLVISINAGSLETKTPTGISSFTSFTVSTGKSYDDVLAKARIGSLDIDGGLYWSYTDSGTLISTCVRPIIVMSQEVYPAAALSQLGLSTQKDAIVITVNAGCYDYDSKGEGLELIACMGEGAMRIIAEIETSDTERQTGKTYYNSDGTVYSGDDVTGKYEMVVIDPMSIGAGG